MVWGRWSVHPWRDPAGRVTGIVLFSEDVSDHVRDRERRLEAERRYRALIDASPDAIILLSGERIEYVNPSGVQLLGGVTVDELLGRSMWDFVLPSQRSRVADRLVLVREGVEVTRSLVGLRQLHGAVRDVEVSSSLVPGGEARVQAIVRDVTDELQVRRGQLGRRADVRPRQSPGPVAVRPPARALSGVSRGARRGVRSHERAPPPDGQQPDGLRPARER